MPLRDPATFATPAWPLRPSSLGKFLRCPMSVILDDGGDGGGNAGAQTGSLVHVGVEQFHRTLNDEEGLRALLAARPLFPLGRPADAERWYRAYVADPANKAATVTHVETKVEGYILGDVYVAGTLDQLRKVGDHYEVWDVKTGGYLQPGQMVDEYQMQQAAYVLLARQSLGLDVRPGGVIRIAGYDKARGDIFLPLGLTVAECELLLSWVTRFTQAVRKGEAIFNPSADHCKFCPVRSFPACARKPRYT